MVSVRLWVEPRLVVSTRRPRPMAIQDLRAAIAQRRGPRSPAELVSMLAERLTDRMMSVMLDLDERLDDIETLRLDGGAREMRQELGAIRRRAIGIRRYIGPQRDALAQRLAEQANRRLYLLSLVTAIFGDGGEIG